MHTSKSAASKGFTLIELLIVIGIIGFLAAAVLVAVDPVKRIQDSRDARRFAEVNAILNAVLNKQVDDRALYNGAVTAPIISSDTLSQVIVTDDTGVVCNADATRPGCHKAYATTNSKDCVANLATLAPTYIASLPLDPRGAGTNPCPTGSVCSNDGNNVIGTTNTGYYINRTLANRIEVGACLGEQSAGSGAISVKR